MFTCHVWGGQMGGLSEDLLMYFSLVCICVCCAVYSQPAVPIWWSYLGSIMSPAGVLLRVVTLAPTALWVIRNHLQQAYPKRTTAVKGVAHSKQSLRGFYWFPHLRASLLLLITDQGTASRSRPWATGAQLEQLAHWQAACIVGEELCRLFRETSQWLRLYISRYVAEYWHGRVSSSKAPDTKQLQIALAIWFLAKSDRCGIRYTIDLTVFSKHFALEALHTSQSTTWGMNLDVGCNSLIEQGFFHPWETILLWDAR